MKNDTIRVGFAGVGFMGQMAHLRNYAELEECEVVALAELRENLGRKVAARYGIPSVYRDVSEMLAAEELDCVVASQPFTRHGILVPEILKKGIPVFTEKPIAGSIPVAEEIVRAVEESGTFLMVGYHKRSDPATTAAKAEIDRLKETGELGPLKYVRILMPEGDWTANGGVGVLQGEGAYPDLAWDPSDPEMSEEEYGAYIGFVNYYIHQVNLMRHLLGESYRVTYADPNGVLLAGASESGVACTIEMSPYRTTIDWQEEALVCFEKGWVKVELPAPLTRNRAGRVTFFADPGEGASPETREPQMPWDHAMRAQARNFLAAVRGDVRPLCGAAEALEDLKVARAYRQLLAG
ncbi:MAG: Gfo/Idh/MocA family protein [Planctomycetota bacterium]|jgi:predicted dehydrogenase